MEKIHMTSVKIYGPLPKNKCKDCYYNIYGLDGYQGGNREMPIINYDGTIKHFCWKNGIITPKSHDPKSLVHNPPSKISWSKIPQSKIYLWILWKNLNKTGSFLEYVIHIKLLLKCDFIPTFPG